MRTFAAEKVVRLLGSRKISSVTARDNAGRTALHLAVIAQNLAVVDVLLNELSTPAEVSRHLLQFIIYVFL